jgi:hypothetical protein
MRWRPITIRPVRFMTLAALAIAGCASAGGGRSAPAGNVVHFDPTYAAWNRVLARAVVTGGVRYAAVRDNMADLRRALAEMEAVARGPYESWTRDERLSFLINAHNAHAMERIGRERPPQPLDRMGGLISARRRRDIRLLGRAWSLRALEDAATGPEFNQARAIFLLNWGARGCAPLPPVAVTALNVEDLMERQTRRVFGDAAYCRFDARGGVLYLTPLIGERRGDFERDFTTLWILADHYLPDEAAGSVRRNPPRIRFAAFDRTLNEAPRLEPQVE